MEEHFEPLGASAPPATKVARKLLMLGGADIQVTAIQKAKDLGYEVITCDYLPGNPGHLHSDKYINVSTTDLEGVLALARTEGISGISAYASDPAAVTAAYVSEKLGLPGDPYEATRIIQDKVAFRAVQHALGIPAPEAHAAISGEQAAGLVSGWKHGGIIKPVDSSGSKGIHHLLPGVGASDAGAFLKDALSFSRSGKVIIEEYIPRVGRQLTGDALLLDGRLRFWCFGDVHFNDRVNGLVPRGVTIPGSMDQTKVNEAMAGVQRIIDHLGLRQGVYNIDIFEDVRGRPIVVDIGARNGGNMLNTLYAIRTGVDLMELSLRMAMGDRVELPASTDTGRFVAHCVVHSTVSGTLRAIHFSPELQACIFHRSLSVKPGDRVGRFVNSGHRLGLLLLEFPDKATMEGIMGDIYRHMVLEVDPEDQ